MALVKNDTYEFTKAIISVIEAGASIGVTLLFPEGHKVDRSEWERAKKRGILRTTIKRLENRRLVEWSTVNGVMKLTLTENGKKRVLQYKVESLKLVKSAKWDGYLRVVIFDIPESKKGVREIFRKKLKDLEFYKLQRSVFVSKYECRSEIDFLKNYYNIAGYVSYILVKEIPDITTTD